MELQKSGKLLVDFKETKECKKIFKDVSNHLRKVFFKMGVVMAPGGIRVGAPGSDMHYACTFPMRKNPKQYETDFFGKLIDLPGVHIVDGSILSALPSKPHTLTIMANADRISRYVCSMFK